MNDSLLTVTVLTASPEAVLELAGELDLSSVPTLDAALGLLDPQAGPVVLDLAQVTFLDSSGMGCIARTHRERQDFGHPVRLRSPQPNVLNALRIAGLDLLVDAAEDGVGVPTTEEPWTEGLGTRRSG